MNASKTTYVNKPITITLRTSQFTLGPFNVVRVSSRFVARPGTKKRFSTSLLHLSSLSLSASHTLLGPLVSHSR